jgi:hypothetical protein
MGLDIFDGLCIDDVLTTRGRLPTRVGESPRVDGMLTEPDGIIELSLGQEKL